MTAALSSSSNLCTPSSPYLYVTNELIQVCRWAATLRRRILERLDHGIANFLRLSGGGDDDDDDDDDDEEEEEDEGGGGGGGGGGGRTNREDGKVSFEKS